MILVTLVVGAAPVAGWVEDCERTEDCISIYALINKFVGISTIKLVLIFNDFDDFHSVTRVVATTLNYFISNAFINC